MGHFAEQYEAHDASLDAHRTELERINLQAGDSGLGQVEREDPTEQEPSVLAGEREAWARGNALSGRGVSFASLPAGQREQIDCSLISSNQALPDVTTMFAQPMTSQDISTSVTKVEASQQGIFASVMEVIAKVTQVIQFTHNQQNVNVRQNQINDEVQ
jgi:hypothetical protein